MGQKRKERMGQEGRMSIPNVVFTERRLICTDCGQDFTYTEGEQRYFWSKGLAEPKRCKPCRVIRRRSIVSVEREHNVYNAAK